MNWDDDPYEKEDYMGLVFIVGMMLLVLTVGIGCIWYAVKALL